MEELIKFITSRVTKNRPEPSPLYSTHMYKLAMLSCYYHWLRQLSEVAELGDFQPENDCVFQLTECFLLELHKMHPSSKNCEEKLRQSRCLTPLPE